MQERVYQNSFFWYTLFFFDRRVVERRMWGGELWGGGILAAYSILATYIYLALSAIIN